MQDRASRGLNERGQDIIQHSLSVYEQVVAMYFWSLRFLLFVLSSAKFWTRSSISLRLIGYGSGRVGSGRVGFSPHVLARR